MGMPARAAQQLVRDARLTDAKPQCVPRLFLQTAPARTCLAGQPHSCCVTEYARALHACNPFGASALPHHVVNMTSCIA